MHSSLSHPANIAENLSIIHKNITQYCENHHRCAEDVQLLAVSKTKPAGDIREAFEAGQESFGENYLQEAIEKIQTLKDLAIEWHFIGAIQSNKTREICHYFDWVHTVDRVKIARRLSEQRPSELPPLNICLQLNISNETSKSGMQLDELPTIAAEINRLPNLCLRGLMAIPASSDSFADQRAEFAKMRLSLFNLQHDFPQMDTLSMGMSNDMEAAIAEGSTIVRIGTAIFGARNTPK